MMPPIPEPSPDLLYSADEMLDYGKACLTTQSSLLKRTPTLAITV